MKIDWTFALKAAAKLLGTLIKTLSPEIRDIVTKTVNEWEAKAKETENPWDDHFVALVKEILGIDS